MSRLECLLAAESEKEALIAVQQPLQLVVDDLKLPNKLPEVRSLL